MKANKGYHGNTVPFIFRAVTSISSQQLLHKMTNSSAVFIARLQVKKLNTYNHGQECWDETNSPPPPPPSESMLEYQAHKVRNGNQLIPTLIQEGGGGRGGGGRGEEGGGGGGQHSYPQC